MKNTFKRTLVMLLALTMIFTSIPIFAVSAKATYNVGDIIELGSYPQSEVTDKTLRNKLSALAGSVNNWLSFNYYIKGNKSNFMKYKDVEYNNSKYRGVYFTSYRPDFTTEANGWVQQSNGYNILTIYWFRYEPLLWQILSYDYTTDTAVMLSKSVIDSQEYYHNYQTRTISGKTVYPNNYENSDIRKWLNNSFYNIAFTSTEKQSIVATSLDNSAYIGESYSLEDGINYYEMPTGSTEYNSNSTTDNIWLLSYDEAVKFNDNISDENAETTKYAKVQGLYAQYGSSWRLRTAGCYYDYACIAYSDYVSPFNTNADGVVYDSKIGIRPALTLKLDNALNIVKEENGYILTAPGVTGEEIITAIDSNAKIYEDNKEVKFDKNTKISTGMKLVTLSGGKITSSKDIAVLGDIDSDGEISVSDARLALRAAVKLDKLTGVYEIAAKVGNDKISVSEARTILRAAVKLENPKYWLK